MDKEEVYYHAIDTKHANYPVVCHNLALGQGILVSASLLRETGYLPGAVSLHEIIHGNSEREKIFEQIRKDEYPTCPTRLGAIYLFENEKNAVDTASRWWGDKCLVFPAEIRKKKSIGRFDAQHISMSSPDEISLARNYWAGEITPEPQIEILLTGSIYLIGWERIAKSILPALKYPTQK